VSTGIYGKIKKIDKNTTSLYKYTGRVDYIYACLCALGYPNRDAAEVALRTVREWLEKNADAVSIVMICSGGDDDATDGCGDDDDDCE